MQGKNLQAYCRTSKIFNAAAGKICRKDVCLGLCEQALVKLDAPMFVEGPLYGVMDNVVDLNGTPYKWLGYVDRDHLDVMTLSYHEINHGSGYRVIDWLYSAKPEELPEGEEILWKISQHLTPQPRREVPGFDWDSGFLDIFSVRNNWRFRRWEEIPLSELLVQSREARKSHG